MNPDADGLDARFSIPNPTPAPTPTPTLNANLRGPISQTFSYARVKEVVTQASEHNNQTQASIYIQNSNFISKKYTAVVTMRIDRYASSITENHIHLSADAKQLLLDEEYLTFFMTCGPNYIRSVHRAQEVTAIFAFEAFERHAAVEFVKALKLYINGFSVHSNRKSTATTTTDDAEQQEQEQQEQQHRPFKIPRDVEEADYMHILDTLSIEMLGYGLGLNSRGNQALIATSLDEFNQVMRFAHESMINFSTNSNQKHYTRNGKLISTTTEYGMIQEMQVAPWVDNAEFLNFAKVDPNYIQMPQPHWYVEDSITVDGQPKCRRSHMIIDSYGKCCEDQDMVHFNATEKNNTTTKKTKCEPMKHVSTAILAKNVQINAEFVSRLGAASQRKIKSLSTLGRCVTTLRSYPERFDYFYLNNNADKVEYNQQTELFLTTKMMKAALDPTGDLGILTMVGMENDEYFEMFYQPCIAALNGMNQGLDKNTDPKYFMAQPWYEHPECNKPSCLGHNMAWDRVSGNDCVEGILGRQSVMSPIPSHHDPHCAISMNATSGAEICKHKPDTDTIRMLDQCRRSLSQQMKDRNEFNLSDKALSLSYLIDQFCMPQLAMDVEPANDEDMDTIENVLETCSK